MSERTKGVWGKHFPQAFGVTVPAASLCEAKRRGRQRGRAPMGSERKRATEEVAMDEKMDDTKKGQINYQQAEYFLKHWIPKIIQVILEGSPQEKIKSIRDFNVLIVDDESGIRESFSMILKDEYNIFTAKDAREALTIISGKDIDVICLDIKMPEMDGLTLLRSIKKDYPDIETVLLTGYPSMDSAIEAMQHGAYNYIVKPFDKDKLKEVIRQGVTRRMQSLVNKRMVSSLIEEFYK